MAGLRLRRRLLAALLLVAVSALAADFAGQLESPLRLSQAARVELTTGEPFATALADLARRGVFSSARQRFYLDFYARLSGRGRDIKAGEYHLEPGLTALGLLRLLVSGKVVRHALQIIEGWRFDQALAAVQADTALKHLLPVDATPATVMEALGHPGQPAEGQFFPDTYYFPQGETDIAVLRRAYRTMHERVLAAWANRATDLPYRTPQDALIVASLIEKETAQPSERPMIAGVFIRRLKRGMRLQTDPSVIYGLGDRYDGHIHSRDLTKDTPYNTYTRSGLPPTPICLPGEASLRAAVHPAPGNALYFVAKGDGSHVFSATLAEHDAAVRRYQLHKRP